MKSDFPSTPPPFADGTEDILLRCVGDFLVRRSTDFYHRR